MADRGPTRDGDYLGVWKLILTFSLAALVLAATVSGATAVSLAGGGALPAGWTHAQINYVSGGTAHTLVLDRGLVTAASASGLTLREQDGSSVQVTLSSTTQVIANGSPGSVSEIRRGETAVTEYVDGGPATLVRLQIPPRLAARIATQGSRG